MPRAYEKQPIDVAGPAGRLEGLVEVPENVTTSGVGLLLHPHPLHQGTMDNKVVHALARGFLAAGLVAVRFNFRGVGDSQGSHGHGEGEHEDAVAVANWARERWPGQPVCLGGFSFGAMVAVNAFTRIAPELLVTVALPVKKIGTLTQQPRVPWLVIQGDEDEIVDAEEVIAWLNGMDPGPELTLMNGVDHFFHGRLTELRDRVAEFLTDNRSS